MTMDGITTHYEVLQVSSDCSGEQIKRAYHTAILQSHPDKQSVSNAVENAADFQRIHEAYQVLRDADARKRYDQMLHEKKLRSELRVSDEILLADMTYDADEEIHTYGCRCGELYVLTIEEVYEQVEIVPCDGCSLNIRVVYSTQSDAN
ncbi:hypothetical protein LEN26_011186 [Aphanomyces euteiches]|nr:hypothetical protein AeMF1_012212 [Aphanomyces euteiches]KAH9120281.1 hypothetical protein LEN26_011186 [Aphanomyces euteiches]KAH9195169.1 hypothetical protein AeNC1_002862 [Aphanomyces euteiches]